MKKQLETYLDNFWKIIQAFYVVYDITCWDIYENNLYMCTTLNLVLTYSLWNHCLARFPITFADFVCICFFWIWRQTYHYVHGT